MTGGTNYETGYLSTVASFPLTCSIPDLPTGASTLQHLPWKPICSEVRTHGLSASYITSNACGLWWVRRGWRTVWTVVRPCRL